jgi:hypothetical protein
MDRNKNFTFFGEISCGNVDIDKLYNGNGTVGKDPVQQFTDLSDAIFNSGHFDDPRSGSS